MKLVNMINTTSAQWRNRVFIWVEGGGGRGEGEGKHSSGGGGKRTASQIFPPPLHILCTIKSHLGRGNGGPCPPPPVIRHCFCPLNVSCTRLSDKTGTKEIQLRTFIDQITCKVFSSKNYCIFNPWQKWWRYSKFGSLGLLLPYCHQSNFVFVVGFIIIIIIVIIIIIIIIINNNTTTTITTVIDITIIISY